MPLAPIQTERLLLRPVTLADVADVFGVLGHGPTAGDRSFHQSSGEEALGWVERRIEDEAAHGYSMWAIERRDLPAIVGFCGFFVADEPNRVELGYVVHADHWGDGIATEAAQAAVAAATERDLEVFATIRPTNERSIRVAERIGLHHTNTINDDRGQLLVWESASDRGPAVADEVRLEGGSQTEVHRRGELVYRSPGPQSATVIRLLAHLEANGFDAAPRPVGTGFAADGREQLTFVSGRSPHPHSWDADATWRIGELLHQLHATTASFDPGPDATWRPWFARSLPGQHRVIGHGDLAPWNIIADGGRPQTFIDWDNAGPVDARWELAQVVWLNAQLHDDDVAELNELPGPAERFHQAAALLDGYRLPIRERTGFVDTMIEFAVRSVRDEARQYAVGPDSVSPASDGFPTLWAVTWRSRAAAWMMDHRNDLAGALLE